MGSQSKSRSGSSEAKPLLLSVDGDAAPGTMALHCPSAPYILLYTWMGLGTLAGNFFGTLGIGAQLAKDWGPGAWAFAVLMALICFFGNVPYNMSPISKFIGDFKKKPNREDGKEGNGCWLLLKIMATLGSLFINVIGQYWAVQTCQIAGRDLKFHSIASNIMSLLFYPMLVLLGTTFVTGLVMDGIDCIENFSERRKKLIQTLQAPFDSCSRFWGSILHLVMHATSIYCVWKVAELEAKAGHDYAHHPEPTDWLSGGGIINVNKLCRRSSSYAINLSANFMVYALYAISNVNIMVDLFCDLARRPSGIKKIAAVLTLILTGLSAGLMAYVGLSNDVWLLPIIVGTAVLNSAPMARSTNTAASWITQGFEKAVTVFKTPDLSSFYGIATQPAPSPV
jgi:hypothetical protein